MKLKTKDMTLVSLFTALTIIGTLISIPIGPVPITLQLLFIILGAVVLGSKLGALSQVIYVALGLAGLPIFAGATGGVSKVISPTFGYLIGYIIAAFVIGKIIECSSEVTFFKIFIAGSIGIIVVYFIGVPYLYVILKIFMGKNISFLYAINIGLVLFIPGDLAKVIVVSFIGMKLIPKLKSAGLV